MAASAVKMLKIQNYQIDAEIFENPIFCTHLKCFRWYGYIIDKNQRWPWLHLLRCTIFTASIWLSCALILMRVFRGYEKLNDGATSYATGVQFLAVSVATLNAYLQRKRVVQLVLFVHNDLKILNSEADAIELLYIKRTVDYIRNITYILWIPSIIAGCIALLDCIYRTIFLPESVFNQQALRRGEAQPILLFKLFPFGEICDNFFVSYLGPWYTLGLGITTIPLWHTFISCFMIYVTLKLQILGKRMSEMNLMRFEPRLQNMSLTQAELNFYRLKLCGYFVEEQLKIRSFVNELGILIRVPVFVDFMIFSVLICFLFFALAVGSPSNMDYFFIFIYIFCMSSILWLYHWHGTLIDEENNKLGFALYCCDWYNYSVPVQKTIRLLMMLTMRPLKIRAIFVELNIRTFLDIVRGSYSYFNLLRSTNLN